MRYLFPRPVFRSQGLSIRGLGIRETMPPSLIQRPSGTGDYLFMFFADPVRINLGRDWRTLEAGSVIFWNRGSPQFYGNPSQSWSHSWIHCNGPDVAKILEVARLPCDRPIISGQLPRLEKYLFDLHEEIANFDRPNSAILRNILENLVLEAARRDAPSPKAHVPQSLLRVRELLDAAYDQRHTLAGLSAQAGFSIPHFCTQFQRSFGVPPIAYLIARRMTVAEALLRDTGGRVGEIGRQVGYDDPYYFSKHFKNFFGFPPTMLRRGNPHPKDAQRSAS